MTMTPAHTKSIMRYDYQPEIDRVLWLVDAEATERAYSHILWHIGTHCPADILLRHYEQGHLLQKWVVLGAVGQACRRDWLPFLHRVCYQHPEGYLLHDAAQWAIHWMRPRSIAEPPHVICLLSKKAPIIKRDVQQMTLW